MNSTLEMQQDGRAAIYGEVVASVAVGALRFWKAASAMAGLKLALVEFHRQKRSDVDDPALEYLAAIPYASYDALVYVTNVSNLVYATTLFDTFLTDTTLFLLFCFPAAIGKNQQIPLSRLLEARTRNEAIADAANRKAREVSFLPFEGRVEFLRHAFGLAIELDEKTSEALRHYPSVRNNIVHDQGLVEIRLDEDGKLTSRQKACAYHPTEVTTEDIANAANAYDNVVLSVARSVFAQVLKAPEHEALARIERAMQRAASVNHDPILK